MFDWAEQKTVHEDDQFSMIIYCQDFCLRLSHALRLR